MYKIITANGFTIGIADPDNCLRLARRSFDIVSEEWIDEDDENENGYDEIIYDSDDPLLV